MRGCLIVTGGAHGLALGVFLTKGSQIQVTAKVLSEKCYPRRTRLDVAAADATAAAKIRQGLGRACLGGLPGLPDYRDARDAAQG